MSDQQKPVYNLSPRVLAIAQMLDMLPPGDYSARVVKPELCGMSWHVEITRNEVLRIVELPQREYRME